MSTLVPRLGRRSLEVSRSVLGRESGQVSGPCSGHAAIKEVMAPDPEHML